MDDFISRTEAIEALENLQDFFVYNYDKAIAIEALDELPSAERIGKWIRYENSVFEKRWKCSRCRRFTFHNGEMLKRYKYCPNCGAKMEGER